MPRSDNQEQYKYGAFDYRTQAEDDRLNREEAQKRKNEEENRYMLEQSRRQEEPNWNRINNQSSVKKTTAKKPTSSRPRCSVSSWRKPS